VAKAVRDSLPPSLLCHWQEALALASLIDDGEKKLGDCQFDLWKRSYVAACAAVDDELRRSRRLDAVQSGCTALSIVKQGDLMIVANVGDSRAVLGTTSDDGAIAAVQLTVDLKPNLPRKSLPTGGRPCVLVCALGRRCTCVATVADVVSWNVMVHAEEKERIRRCNGQVYCLADEPGVHRVWQPSRESPGLAMSRAFGDYCVKDCGVISTPEVTQKRISSSDQFIILATDGVAFGLSAFNSLCKHRHMHPSFRLRKHTHCLVTDDGKREFYPIGMGRALQRRGGTYRGGDAGPGEGGQAAGGVRRSRVEAQAARHRRR
jgi:hypothetical protein